VIANFDRLEMPSKILQPAAAAADPGPSTEIDDFDEDRRQDCGLDGHQRLLP